MRARYAELIARPQDIEDILREGARKARAIAAPFLATLREAVGLRRFVAPSAAAPIRILNKPKAPEFKQYREADGFYFKLVDGQGKLLLQSRAFAHGKDAGQWVGRLRREGVTALAESPVDRADGASEQEVAAALVSLAAE
jgi:tryptophanyl-tRNA synthetase